MPLNRTLGELRSELSARLGYGASGANVGALVSILNNMLFSSQVALYWEFDWKALRTYVTDTIGASQTNVDFPGEIHPDRVDGISVKYSNVWLPYLSRGISAEMYTSQDREGVPTHWDINQASGSAQIEFWPQTDTSYSYRVFGTAPLGDFFDDGHYTTIDSDLVVLHALVAAKAHYRHPDATLYQGQLDALLARQKSNNWRKRVFEPRDDAGAIIPKPLVVGRDV